MNKGLTELVMILDASGSMYGLTSDTMGGYDSFIEAQKKLEGAANITLVTFNTDVTEVYKSKPIQEVEKLTDKEYRAGGMTALYDAIGITMDNLKKRIAELPEEEKPEKVMIVITTDGYENSSKEYNQKQVKELIDKQKELGWEVIFIGANIDTAQESSKIGLDSARAASYQATGLGVATMYCAVSKAVSSVRETGILDELWANDLQQED